MTTIAQRSFAGGEIAPALYARTDQVKYATGLRTLLNGFVMKTGGVANRAGTVQVGEIKNSNKTARLIPFVFNSDQTYSLEFGDQTLRVIRDGAYVTNLTLTITAISNANPGVVTYTGTDPANGDEVYIDGIIGPIGNYLNGRTFIVANVSGAGNTFELTDRAGSNINTTAYGAYTSGGTAKRIYTIATSYTEANLPGLRFAQSADVVTITSTAYPPAELSRTGDASWSFASITFAPAQDEPSNIAYSSIAAGAILHEYQVTAVSPEGEESLIGSYFNKVITGATQANPCALTVVGHGWTTGDKVSVDSVGGMVQLNDRAFLITVTGLDTFTLDGVDSTAYTAYTAGGNARRVGFAGAAPTAADPHILTWSVAAGSPTSYNIYKSINGVFGFLGVASVDPDLVVSVTFNDTGATPDALDTPPQAFNPFDAAGDYPAAVTYCQQRSVYGGSTNTPETGYMSRIGQFKNFTKRTPTQDDDSIIFVLAGREVNAIQHLLEITGKLVVFTGGGELLIQGNADGVITPAAVNTRQYTYNGTGDLRPLVAGGQAIYVQARGAAIRNLSFDEIKGLESIDLSIFSAHMLDGHTIVDWAYQKTPHSIVWAVRDDGVLLGMTFVREHEIVGWHRHEFENGTVENVCAIPEGDEDALYLIVKRTISGQTRRYVERMDTRQIDDIKDLIILDSALTYDGRNTGATTMTLSGSGWTYADTLTLTASASYFIAGDVGNFINLRLAGELVRCEITGYTGVTVVSVRPDRTVPASMQAVAITDWGKAVDELHGLWHLEGEDVGIFADGFVVASPKNSAYGVKTVATGAVTITTPAEVIHVGLPITSDFETLDPDVNQGETIIDKNKRMGKVTIFCEKTRGVFAGPKPPESSERFDEDDPDYLLGLDELKIRGVENEGYDDPVALLTGTAQVIIRPNWNNNGRVFLRQVDPLPFAILAIAPAGDIPIRG